MMSSTSHQNQETNQPVDPAEILNEIAAGHIESGRLAELSDLSRAQLETFADCWTGVPPDRKQETARTLYQLSLDNIGLDFSRIFHHLLSDENEAIRALAVQGLWEDDSTSFLLNLVYLAHNDSSSAVQQAVAEILGRFCFEAEIDMLDEQSGVIVRDALYYLLDNGSNWMVRRRALESAAYMTGDSIVHQAILDAYESGFEQEQAGAIVAMGRQLRDEWFPIILRELTNEDPDIRCEAARAAGEFEKSSAIDQLAKMIDDEDDEIRAVAILSIGQIGGKKAADTLVYLETQVSDEYRLDLIEQALEEATFLQESTGLEDEW
jgi:HEAT repeat protein